jgi:hypothetical protein
MNHQILFFVAVAVAILGQGLDDITTNNALAHGAKETNALVAWAIKKIGFPAVAFIKVGGLAIGLPVLLFSLKQPVVGAIVAFAAAGVGLYAGIANYLAEKKTGVDVL